MEEESEKPEQARQFRKMTNDGGCGRPERIRSGGEISVRNGHERHGFVHVLWLLVVLGAILLGATLVNMGMVMKMYEAASRQNAAIENLTQSMKQVRDAVLYLSRIIEEAEPVEEGDQDKPTEEGRI